jgi:hypothetical protein
MTGGAGYDREESVISTYLIVISTKGRDLLPRSSIAKREHPKKYGLLAIYSSILKC